MRPQESGASCEPAEDAPADAAVTGRDVRLEPVTVVVTFVGRAVEAVRWLEGVSELGGDPHCRWTWDRGSAP